MSTTATFGDVLRGARESRPPAPGQTQQRAHLSQCALGRRAGVHSGLVCRYEAGRKLPNVAILARLVAALGCSDEEIARMVRAAEPAEDDG